MFEPIAIVGQACALPGALTPEQLWRSILDRQNLLSSVPKHYWRVDPRSLLNSKYENECCWNDRGGYVNGFESVFDATGLAIPESRIESLDPLFQWLLYSAREASNQINVLPRKQTGFIVGNLSYPSPSFARYAETAWLGDENLQLLQGSDTSLMNSGTVSAENRFVSGLPAHLVAQALQLEGESFCLDAACASSLYAVKLACDRLHDRNADAMLVGAVNRADDLFLHMGFTALRALSKSGQSRPFHQQADGLVPAEGAVCLVLKRLSDALSDNERVLAVIRAVGLSNDGRGKGFLSPSSNGQVQAMRSAYEQCELSPSSISLIECHATGTPVGDATEITSMKEVFNPVSDLVIGSLKSNLGHLITVSGLAGMLKVIAAINAGVRPPSLHTQSPIAELQDSSFRLLSKAEPWISQKPLRAAVNSFGFGGNNAHLIIEQYCPETPTPAVKRRTKRQPIAIVGMGGMVNDGRQLIDFVQALYSGTTTKSPKQASTLRVPLTEVHFPPNDLKTTLPQQLVLLNAALEAVQMVKRWTDGLTGTYIGMQCDSEIARYGIRWRLRDWIKALPLDLKPSLQEGLDTIVPCLESAAVVGTMPNMPANRLNSQFDWKGPSFTVSSEELSGIDALDIACRALAHREIDVALVGAVDLSCEPVHEQAARNVLPESLHSPGDAAIALVLKRLDDAKHDANPIFAIIPDQLIEKGFEPTLDFTLNDEQNELTRRFGHAHAASGLLHIAVAAIACATRALPLTKKDELIPWLPSTKGRQARVSITSFSGQKKKFHIAAPPPSQQHFQISDPAPRIRVYSGKNIDEIVHRLEQQKPSNQGPCRLAIVSNNNEELFDRIQRGKQLVMQKDNSECDLKLDTGIYFRQAPLVGDVGFVFTGAASAFRSIGTPLLIAMPELADKVLQRFPGFSRAIQEFYQVETSEPLSPFDQLKASSFLCQVHAELSQKVLGLRPQATLGVSSGETNALFALGVWRDMKAMFTEIQRSRMYDQELAGNFRAAKQAWGLAENAVVNWSNWRILADRKTIDDALISEPLVSLLIVNSPSDCIIGGELAACRRVIEVIGNRNAHPLGQDMIVHCLELGSFTADWFRIHCRNTIAQPNIRFYSNAIGTHYSLNRETIAENLTLQAKQCIDFPRTVNNAWQDGVRVFIEHGPRSSLTESIQIILKDREHLAVSLDAPTSTNSIMHLFETVAQLVVAGVPVDYQKLESKFVRGSDTAFHSLFRSVAKKPTLKLPVHYPPISISLKKPSQPESNQEYMIPASPVSLWIDDRPMKPKQETLVQKMLPPPTYKSNPLAKTAEQRKLNASSKTDPTRSIICPSSDQPTIDLFSKITEIHQNYLQQQARIHQQYMTLQERIWDLGLVSVAKSENKNSTIVTKTPDNSIATPISEEKLEVAVAPSDDASILSQHVQKPPESRRNDVQLLPKGPCFSRKQLEVLASGTISTVLGEPFRRQDHYRRQVRLPKPPLLLVDRVTGIDGDPGSMGLGTIWTETDIFEDAWYLHHGVMPPGILIESGQADLLLISWLGADFHNRDQRVYRLLGCELTFHDVGLPKPGDTLCYEIHIDGHARTNQSNLFFFHYDCRVGDQLQLSVRNGQAGFFSDQELDQSKGVLWDPATVHPKPDAKLDPPPYCSKQRSFSVGSIQSWCRGDAFNCFGQGFEQTATHHRTPTIPSGGMCLIDEVKDFDPSGGPWGRGYMRAETKIQCDDWFFEGHFKNDPCMPGTLMAEASVQVMSLYMTALGCTLQRDYWRFEPITNETFKFICRGQVTPESRHLVYEIFIEEFSADPIPTLFVAVSCSADGLNVFHCRRFGLRMVPDWPLTSQPISNDRTISSAFVGEESDVRGDYDALLACAWGPPSSAFGSMYEKFDAGGRVPRLPGPPYHFMSKIIEVEGKPGVVQVGAKIQVEYHIPKDAWYFKDNSAQVMPFCVLLETMLQPCGWMASYQGIAAASDDTLSFRNLDGHDAEQAALLTPSSGTLLTEVTLTDVSRLGQMTLVSFRAASQIKQQNVLQFNTSFGFFISKALMNQVGLPAASKQRELLHQSSDFYCDLRPRPKRYFLGDLILPDSKLLMLDEITGYWPDGGCAGLGRIRGNQFVDPKAWYFKAHFFQDPVQPGSLGMEALIQLLHCFAIKRGLGEELSQPTFESMALAQPFEWKYRGQVLATNKKVTTDIEVTEIKKTPGNVLIRARGDLWVDDLRIYSIESFSIRIVDRQRSDHNVETLNPQIETWLLDHRPTWTVPTLPLMSMADRLAHAAELESPGALTGLHNLRVHRWLTLEGPTRIKTETKKVDNGTFEVNLLVWRVAIDAQLSRYETVASATAVVDGAVKMPDLLPELIESKPMEDPYTNGRLFHGPAFQLMTDLKFGQGGSSAFLKSDLNLIPQGSLNQGLLDAATHTIPHDRLHIWDASITEDQAAYPFGIVDAFFVGTPPSRGKVRCETRFLGYHVQNTRFPLFHIQLSYQNRIWCDMKLVEILLPKGPLGHVSSIKRLAFVRDRISVPGMALSRFEGDVTRLSLADIKISDWLPGTVAQIYQAEDPLLEQVAIKDHVANKTGAHPSDVRVEGNSAIAANQPLSSYSVNITKTNDEISISDRYGPQIDTSSVAEYWRNQLSIGAWPMEDLYLSLIRRFVGQVSIEDPRALEPLKGKPVLFLANHQVAIESLLFAVLASSLFQIPTALVAKSEHRKSWLGRLIQHGFSYPGIDDPGMIHFFERENPASFPSIINGIIEHRSLMVHVEGTRALCCGNPVSTLSSVLLDLAINRRLPIVPVLFSKGLPRETLPERLEFPYAMGRQDYFMGKPILPSEIAELAYKERREFVLAAINEVGPSIAQERPSIGDTEFAQRVQTRQSEMGISQANAVLIEALEDVLDPSIMTAKLLNCVNETARELGSDPNDSWLRILLGQLKPSIDL